MAVREYSLTKKRLRLRTINTRAPSSKSPGVFADEEAIETEYQIESMLPTQSVREYSLTKKRLRLLVGTPWGGLNHVREYSLTKKRLRPYNKRRHEQTHQRSGSIR